MLRSPVVIRASFVGQGYSNRTARGTAVGDEPQTVYARRPVLPAPSQPARLFMTVLPMIVLIVLALLVIVLLMIVLP